MSNTSDTPRAQRGASRKLNFIIFGLCRFISAHKAGLSRHLPVKVSIWFWGKQYQPDSFPAHRDYLDSLSVHQCIRTKKLFLEFRQVCYY
jgi:hypothetical protein